MTYSPTTHNEGYRYVTLDDIVKAAEENGYEWNRSGWFAHGADGAVVKACILGQVAINLSIESGDLADYLGSFRILQDKPIRTKYPALHTLYNITLLNDTPENPFSPKTYKGLLKVFKEAVESAEDFLGKEKGVNMRQHEYRARKKRVR